MDIDAARRALRDEHGASLARRRRVALLAGIGLVDFAVISLYQTGVIRHLPDPPGRIFDSDCVNASRKAYRLGVPDGPLGALLQAATLTLAAAGGRRGTGRRRIFDWLLGGATLAGAAAALDYLRDMIFVERRACPYCLLAAGLSLAMLPPALRELL